LGTKLGKLRVKSRNLMSEDKVMESIERLIPKDMQIDKKGIEMLIDTISIKG
jgi:hypothetical protein